MSGDYQVYIGKEDFSFNASHFIAYKGFREKLHGHNYKVGVRLWGTRQSDGYVVDFGVVKEVTRSICKSLKESFLCPMNSDVLKITEVGSQLNILCEDGSNFSFPSGDCTKLPIIHSSVEELAYYISGRIVDSMTLKYLVEERHVTKIEVAVSEAPDQEARYTRSLVSPASTTTTSFNPSPCISKTEE